jgi:NAD(P)-dependent dehydrogenase (short-subunit alcohol dehydrogenase family)
MQCWPPATGKMSVITGGATGIGRGLAIALTAQGLNVVLASTNEKRLARAANDVSQTTSSST